MGENKKELKTSTGTEENIRNMLKIITQTLNSQEDSVYNLNKTLDFISPCPLTDIESNPEPISNFELYNNLVNIYEKINRLDINLRIMNNSYKKQIGDSGHTDSADLPF